MFSLFSSFTVYADAPEEKTEEKTEETPKEEEEQIEVEEVAVVEEEEEEEPEDIYPAIREECEQSKACSGAAKHFQHCQEKVQGGEGFKGEDCVEELMMHCVDTCSAPKLFSKLV
ncbi:hypothetical protein FIBSPDRAFT_1036252 [Athelia psychrophila]|uniref:Ubiquinol-cytochrome C reductase hinge domain-containing protein n=1 Tax=Athelia psychrophila TaxID=1759441 RepID=A0A166VVF7_9AGAM|nr:hypothetical protein FIBSPDRAFT_1036252 [Fibularhizoctonia sp. CBS 109695]